MKPSCLILITLCVFCGFSCKRKTPEKIIRPVKIMEVRPNAFVEKTFSGYAEAEEYAYLAFRVGGMLLSLDVEEGQDVKIGQLIATLDPRDYQLKLTAAKASYQQSQSQVERYSRLYEKSAISKQEYEIARATFENNKAVYSQTQNDMNYTRLRAPFAGNIEKKYAENHQQVTTGEKIVKINNPKKIQFRFTLPETNMQYSSGNFRYSVELDIQKGIFYKAKLKELVSSSVGGSGVPVILKIDDPLYNPQKVKILPGYACNVKIEAEGKTSLAVIAIPITCIYNDPETNKTYVWKVDKTLSVVHKTLVKTGDFSGTSNIFILSGLREGDYIVAAGVEMLADGESVKIMEP